MTDRMPTFRRLALSLADAWRLPIDACAKSQRERNAIIDRIMRRPETRRAVRREQDSRRAAQ